MGKGELTLSPIGTIRTPFRQQKGTPVQPAYGKDARGQVVVRPEFADGLDDLEGFDYVWLLFWLDRARPFKTKVVPYRDVVERGLFATRAPARPNPIGLSMVKVESRDGNVLHVSGLDILDNTPLLDIKPYVPEFDACPDAVAGWLHVDGDKPEQADERFETDERA